MKKFSFSLGRMLDYKNQLLSKEKNTLAQLRAQQDQIALQLENLKQSVISISAEMYQKTSAGTTIAMIRSYEFQIENIRSQIKQLERESQLIAAAVENQMKVVVTASQDVSSLDKLKEKQAEEYQHEVAKADELFISELVSSNLIRQQAVSS